MTWVIKPALRGDTEADEVNEAAERAARAAKEAQASGVPVVSRCQACARIKTHGVANRAHGSVAQRTHTTTRQPATATFTPTLTTHHTPHIRLRPGLPRRGRREGRPHHGL